MARRNKRSRRNRDAEGICQLPWQEIVNTYRPQEILSTDQIEHIHNTSLRLLEEYGMRVMHAGTRKLLAQAGAEVDQRNRNGTV